MNASLTDWTRDEAAFRRWVLVLCLLALLIQIATAGLLFWKVSADLALLEVYNQDTRERLVKLETMIARYQDVSSSVRKENR